jgi:hypothetical protein
MNMTLNGSLAALIFGSQLTESGRLLPDASIPGIDPEADVGDPSSLDG